MDKFKITAQITTCELQVKQKASQIPSPYNQKETEEKKDPSKTVPQQRPLQGSDLSLLLFLIPLPMFAFFLPISNGPETQGRLDSKTGLAEGKEEVKQAGSPSRKRG